MTKEGSAISADLDAAVAFVTEAAAQLAVWHAGRVTPDGSYVVAGHDCLDSIDDALSVLHEAREALVAEIREDQIKRAERVDQLLAGVEPAAGEGTSR